MKNCKLCHECGAELREVLDGEEWCDKCKEYKRYASHGWKGGTGEDGCPTMPELDAVVLQWAKNTLTDYDNGIFAAHGSSHTWATNLHPEKMSYPQYNTLCESLAAKLILVGAIKPDYRKHKGFQGDGRTYRLSRGWFNKYQKEAQ